MSLINTRIVKLDVSPIVQELQRLNRNLEEIFQINAPVLVPNEDFDPDDYSSVMYTDEEAELVDEQVRRRILGT